MATDKEIKAKLLEFMLEECSVPPILLTVFRNKVIGRFSPAERAQAEEFYDEVFVFEFVPRGARIDSGSILECPARIKDRDLTSVRGVSRRGPAVLPRTAEPAMRAARQPTRAEANRVNVTQEVLDRCIESGTIAKKSEIVDTIDDKLEDRLSQADIESVFNALRDMILEHMAVPPRGPGMFELTGLFKLEVVEDEEGFPEIKFTARKKLRDAIVPPK